MNARPTKRGQTVPQLAVALGAIAVVGVAFAVLVSRPSVPSDPGASPSAPVATPRPSAPATPVPATPAPSSPAKPSPSGNPTAPTSVRLESPTGHDVRLAIDDPWKTLADAVSGHPGDGMSVRWHDALVEQVGSNAVRITWVAFPDDLAPQLGILDLDGGRSVAIVQRGPVPYSDALGEDRVVVLTFHDPVDARSIDVKVIDDMVH
jgi:hypothetical protein